MINFLYLGALMVTMEILPSQEVNVYFANVTEMQISVINQQDYVLAAEGILAGASANDAQRVIMEMPLLEKIAVLVCVI